MKGFIDEFMPSVLGAFAASMLMLTVLGAVHGFWLFHNPVHTPWWWVWESRGSAMAWLLLIATVLYRHIMRRGKAS